MAAPEKPNAVETYPAERFEIKNEDDVRAAVMVTYSDIMQRYKNATLATQIATCVSELAMNIVKYAKDGQIHLIYRMNLSIEIIAEDRGPGIIDTTKAMQDHYSSKGTLGLGLPGVQRMVDEFNIQSVPNKGTRVRALKWVD